MYEGLAVYGDVVWVEAQYLAQTACEGLVLATDEVVYVVGE